MGAVCSGPTGLELTEHEKKKCVVLLATVGQPKHNKELSLLDLAKLGIYVHAAEVVVYVRPPPIGSAAAEQSRGVTIVGDDLTAVAPDQLKRILRALIVTPGTVQLMARRGFAVRQDGKKKYPNCIFALRQLRLVAYDDSRDLMILMAEQQPIMAQQQQQNVPRHISMYQTPFPARFVVPMAQALADAFVGVPPWAIPVQLKLGSLPLPASTAASQAQALGNDGGFATCFAANAVATLIFVQSKEIKGNRVPVRREVLNVRRIISHIVQRQQPQDLPWLKGRVHVLDVGSLVDTFLAQARPVVAKGRKELRDGLVVGALDCLPFNLEFRILKMNNIEVDCKMHLSRVLLYNVTLREIDLAGTSLRGMGQDLGQALSMNIQPLVSHLDLSGCQFDDADWLGLVVGLARLWCGGSAVPQSLSVANNIDVKASSWSVLWDLLVDPSTFARWPTAPPPPPPNLCFFQHLDIRGTLAADGPHLAKFVDKLTGLRSLFLGCNSQNGEWMDVVLQAIASSDAPLEVFYGLSMQLTGGKTMLADALHRHIGTLRKVVLENFSGDAGILICMWPSPVPTLSLEFKGNLSDAFSAPPENASSHHFSPGSLKLRGENQHYFRGKVLSTLASQAAGLTSLYLHGGDYVEIVENDGAETQLATCGLKILHFTSSPSSQKGRIHTRNSCSWKLRQQFWSTFALSRTLEEIQVLDQLQDCSCGDHEDEVAMVGRFLRTNRSVRRINFDSNALSLNVESVKVLCSAFYGNKKLVAMTYPRKSQANTVRKARESTEACSRQVVQAKKAIKQIFKSHYSKYNPNWRDKPNRLKLPYVEQIITAKRKIGKTNRDTAKIGVLLDQVSESIASNKAIYDVSMAEKTESKLARCEPRLTNIVAKKKQVVEKLITKLHRCKRRGRQKKSGKEQVHRSYYYKNKHMWPEKRTGRTGSSHYRRWNDPYGVRCLFPWPYDQVYDHERTGALPIQTTPEIEDEQGGGESEIVVESDDIATAGIPYVPGLPPYVLDRPEDSGLACEANLVASPECGLFPDLSIRADDPWHPIDSLITQPLASPQGMLTSSAYLSQIHVEASELGLDVLADIAPILDAAASLDGKVESIATRSGLETSKVSDYVASVPNQGVDLNEVMSDLPVVDDYALDEADDAADEADDAVEMYAGAGPRDLDDGGPFFGGSSVAALAGARRRARTRKINRVQQRVREAARPRLQQGYANLLFPRLISSSARASETEPLPFGTWPDDISGSWKDEVTAAQIEVLSRSEVISLPEVSVPRHILKWSKVHSMTKDSESLIEVALVTQCSVDRLGNLRKQLAAWRGKASVAVYVKSDELSLDIENMLFSLAEEAKLAAIQSGGDCSNWDVAVCVVEARIDDEPYPINYLRNVAFLQARSEFVRTGGSLEESAVLLVDVDFRSSSNLHEALHCNPAADEILYKRRVIVCPAFEDSNGGDLPRNISELRKDVDNDTASGFHISHFPPGHCPTDFEAFWSASSAQKSATVDLWKRIYPVKYQKLFEPYVVLRTPDVPLYDERFQGYGLNKVSHLASIAKQKCNELFVLPGVFLVAPCHRRSQSWVNIYGFASDEACYSKLCLKGLYHNFSIRLNEGKAPVVSSATENWQEQLLKVAASKHVSEILLEAEQI